MPKAQRLEGKVGLVTGGVSGIGAAISRRFLEEGCEAVYIIDPKEATPSSDLCKDLTSEFRQKLHIFKDDVSNTEGVLQVLKVIADSHNRLDILVNNAGLFVYSAADTVTADDLDQVHAVNIKAPVLLTKNAVPLLESSKRGAIINISSVNAVIAIPGILPYSLAKGAISQVTRNAAVDLGGKFNIRVNAVCPGLTMTAAVEETARGLGLTLEQFTHPFIERNSVKRIGAVEDVAAAVSFLASEDAAFITGANLLVDGGYTIA